MRDGANTKVRAPLTIGSLFSGIGGLERGLEGAGLGPVVFQVEIDPFCRAVLARHWPDARRFEDVRAVGRANLPAVDVLCGGFPCQGISTAGKRLGLADERSGLWSEFARIVRELRPRFVVVENVARLASSGLDVVVGDLAREDYRVEGRILAARDVGAPHRRERVFLLAYAGRDGREGIASLDSARRCVDEQRRLDASRRRDRERASLADTDGEQLRDVEQRLSRRRARRVSNEGESEPVHDRRSRGSGAQPRVGRRAHGISGRLDEHQHADVAAHRWPAGRNERQHDWEPRRAKGAVANRFERLSALGNAVVPQVARVVGERVVALARGER